MSGTPERWAEQARYDLETARYACVGSFVVRSLLLPASGGKMLKSLIAKRTGAFPPRSHNLMRLAEKASVEMDQARATVFRELSEYYIQSRYPEEMPQLAAQISSPLATHMLEKTEEVISWLSSMP